MTRPPLTLREVSTCFSRCPHVGVGVGHLHALVVRGEDAAQVQAEQRVVDHGEDEPCRGDMIRSSAPKYSDQVDGDQAELEPRPRGGDGGRAGR